MSAVFDELVMLLNSGISQRRMYFGEHPKVAACSREFARRLPDLLRERGRDAFFIGVADGKLVHEGRFLIGSTIVGRQLIATAENLRCGGLLFGPGTTAEDVRGLFEIGATLEAPVADLSAARALLAAHGVRHVELSPPYRDAGWLGQELPPDWGGDLEASERLESLVKSYQSLFHAVDSAHGAARRDDPPDVDGARTASERMLRNCRGGFMDIMRLVRYPDYDTYTVGHSVRVAMIAVLVGHQLGLDDAFLAELGTAGLLHDIGKAKIPEEILYKPSRLDPEERRIIEDHVTIGARLLLETRDAGPLALGAAWGHHLRHDGGGYPRHCAWGARNSATELIHVCDVFEAVTAVRPYKSALTPQRAYEIMLADPGEFDPAVLGLFVKSLGLYPPGSRVQLSGGEVGLVVAPGTAIDRPLVQLTHAPSGEPYPAAGARIVDLGADAGRALSVVGLLQETPQPASAPV